MPRRLSTPEEFEIGHKSIIHTPTGAEWRPYPVGDGGHFFPRQLLPNGDDYDQDAVISIMKRLWGAHKMARATRVDDLADQADSSVS
jgi:hypothetical protein